MSDLKPGLYATFETTQGNITVQLFPDQAPKTVANFVGLANGAVEYVDAKTRQRTKGRFYDGLAFHRVIPNFMIQGGCPLGNGTGGPGFQFEDEFAKGLGFERPGMLAMANSGPNTNGSQFFITVAATTWLNNRHTIFGQVVKGQDVVEKISAVPRDRRDQPSTPVVLKALTIQEVK
jgi:peptidyl-prolyl cis-trans isomerase A (cyclophilin A)